MRGKVAPKSVIEKFMLPNPQWHEGYSTYMRYLGYQYAQLCVLDEGNYSVVCLDRKGASARRIPKTAGLRRCDSFVKEYAKQAVERDGRHIHRSSLIRWPDGKRGAVINVCHMGRLKGLMFFFNVPEDHKSAKRLELFQYFVASQVELAYKNFELNNFYETVHPRALALSTIHSVHRVISSSLRLQDLLPRIGRLAAQVLKAHGCSIMLVDAESNYLMPYFSVGVHPRFVHCQRVRIGRGLQGRIAATGEYHLSRHSIAIPFIEDDIVGVIALWNKADRKPFSKIDLEILKSLSEQAVVAIKNAQLFEETEQLTLGSIKTINELLELNFGGDRSQVGIFSKIVTEMARELELTARERMHLDRAILLLDTGALTLPEKVMLKEGKLTKKELEQIRRIPSRGASILRSISSLKPIIPIILHHHERYDGKGYPQGLAGEEIPIGARIVSVVNSFIAMISKRSYREKLSIKQALAEIESNQNTQFDPRVVRCFLNVMKRKDILENIQTKQNDVRKKKTKTPR